MIKTKYWNDMNHYYMILEEGKERSYPMQMVLNNRISGILPAELRREDNCVFCYYEISGKESLGEFLEHGVLNETMLKNLLIGVIQAVQSGQGYLLEENDFILAPEYIYWDAKKEEVSLCYHSRYQVPFQKQMESLIEFLLHKVNYREEGAVLLIYALYKKVHEAGCTFGDLLDLIEEIKDISDCNHGTIERVEEEDRKETQDRREVHEEKAVQNRNKSKQPGYRPMREKVESEMEILRYPTKNYILAGSAVLVCCVTFFLLYRFHIFEKAQGTGVEMSKIIGVSVLLLILLGYFCYRLFEKSQKAAKIVRTTQYIETDHLGSTTVLCDFSGKEEVEAHQSDVIDYQLRPMDETQYKPIILTEFPFFIGKLQSAIGHTISNDTVSRFHAKIDIKNTEIYLMDLNSTNGTYWNGEKLKINEKRALRSGDIISFANVRYQFCEFCKELM